MENANDWFYLSGDDELGPFSGKQLQELLAGGEIGPDTMARKRSWMDWRPAGEIDFRSLAPGPQDNGHNSAPASALAIAPPIPAVSVPGKVVLRGVGSKIGLFALGGAVTAALFAGILLLHRSGKEVVSTPTRQQGGFDPDLWEEVSAPTRQVPQATVSAQPRPWDNDPIIVPAPAAPSLSPKASGKPLDPVALFANSRGAVATILTEDDLGFDVGQGSGFFIAPELVGPRYQELELWQKIHGEHRVRLL